MVNFGGAKDRLHAENGGLRNGTQQDLNNMVDMVKLGGGSKKIIQMPKMGGKAAAHTYWLSKRECPLGLEFAPNLLSPSSRHGTLCKTETAELAVSLVRARSGQIPSKLSLNKDIEKRAQANSSPPSATYMRQWIGSPLVQIMACRLFGTKSLSKPIMGYC